jgi:two-component system, NtrC family, sensor kinase
MESQLTYQNIRNKLTELEEENLLNKQRINELETQVSKSKQAIFAIFETMVSGIVLFWDNKIEYVNPATKALLGANDDDEYIGKSPIMFVCPEFKELAQNRIKLLLSGKKQPTIEEKFIRLDNQKIVDVLLSSSIITIENKKHYLVVLNDISEKNHFEIELKKSIERLQSLYGLNKYNYQTEKDFISFIIEEAERISNSKISFFHFVNDNQVDLSLMTWSKNTLFQCTAPQLGNYKIEDAGIWVECLSTGKPMIYNNYTQIKNKKGVPEGHFPLIRFMTFPIVDNGKFVAICGVGNKETDYEEDDKLQLSIFLDAMWAKLKSFRIEQQLIESENKYRSIIECSNDGILIISHKTILFANNKFAEITGYRIEQLINKEFFSLYDFDSAKKVIQYYTARMNGDYAPNTYEVNIKTNRGELIPVEQVVNIIEYENKNSELIFIRDIRDRKAHDLELLKLSKAVEYSPTSIIIADNDGLIEYVNPVFSEQTGYSPEEVIGKSHFFLKSDKYPHSNYNVIWSVINSGNAWKGEVYNKKKSGELYWVLSTISSIKDEKGNLQKFVSINEDITYIKNKEAELEHSNTNLKLLNECHIILLNSESEDEMLFAFCELAVTSLAFDLVAICDYHQEADMNYVELNAYSSSEIQLSLKKGKIINIDNNCKIIQAIADNNLTICNNNDKCSRCFKGNFEFPYESMVVVPFVKNASYPKALILVRKDFVAINDKGYHLIYELINYIIFGIDILKERQDKKKYEEIHLFEKEQLNVTLNSITDAVITVNREGYINYINIAAYKLLDVNENELLGKRVFDIINLFDLKDQKILFNPFDLIEEIHENKDLIKSTYLLLNNTNHRKYVNITTSKILDTGSLFIGVVIVIKDITNLVKIETQVALSQKMESVGQLASGIAHEINTPMQFVGDNTFFLKESFESIFDFINSVRKSITDSKFDNLVSYIEFMRDKHEINEIEYLSHEIPTAINRTLDGIDRVRKIVIAMKNFAHSSGKQKAQSNINQGIDVTVTISKNEWKYIAELSTELNPELPPVFCSLDEINQVILNMIVNSSHAIGERKLNEQNFEGKIQIKTYFDSINAFIEITDNGMGIAKDKINRIFDPFFTTKEVGKGTGQGLSIAHNIIVNKHKGTIEVESKRGVGTKFIISLPILGAKDGE